MTWYSPPNNRPGHDIYQYNMGSAPWDFAGQQFVLRLYFDVAGRYQSSEVTVD